MDSEVISAGIARKIFGEKSEIILEVLSKCQTMLQEISKGNTGEVCGGAFRKSLNKWRKSLEKLKLSEQISMNF